MKNHIFIFGLRALKGLASLWQMGNPFHQAPFLVEEPGKEEGVIMYMIKEDDTEVRIWQLYKILATALYGGALINRKNKVYKRFVFFPWGKALHPVFSFPFIGKRFERLSKAIYLITPEANGNYYHWMIDLLPRLLLIKKHGPQDFLNRPLILHFPQRTYEKHALELLNIPAENVVRIKPFELVEVQDLIVSDHYSDEKHFPKWKKTLLKEFRELVKSPVFSNEDYSKVYLFRGNQKVRRLIGEEHLVQILKKRGFQIVDPQKLSLADQIVIMKQAKMVIALHGAALTNIIFCEEGSCVIELRSDHNSPEHYSSIAKAYDLDFQTIYLPPARFKEKRHHANKENLQLTDESLRLLLAKISKYERSSLMPLNPKQIRQD